MSKLRAIIKRPDEEFGHVTNISDTLENLQRTVGGYIETVTITAEVNGERKRLVIVCDEEGRLKGKDYNCTVLGVLLRGDIVVLGVNEDEFDDCPLMFGEWKEILSRGTELWRSISSRRSIG